MGEYLRISISEEYLRISITVKKETCHGLQCGRRVPLLLTLLLLSPLLAAFSPTGLNITVTLFTNQSVMCSRTTISRAMVETQDSNESWKKGVR